jgi:hypothetical protein
LAVVLLALVGMLAVFPRAAEAAGTCTGEAAGTRHFVGALSTGEVTYGPDASIERRVPQLCSGRQTFSAAWSLLAGPRQEDGYAQIGQYHSNGFSGVSGYYTFTEWVRCSVGCFVHFNVAPGPTTAYRYKVLYSFANTRLSMIRGSTSFAVTDFDPFVFWGTPFENQFFAETNNAQTDIIGTLDDAAEFNGIQKKNSDGTFSQINSLGLARSAGSPSRYDEKWGNQPRLFYVWTYPL